MKQTLHMIKTHPMKSLAFFSGCGVVIGTGYYAKLRMDTNEAIRKTRVDKEDAFSKIRNDTDEAIRKKAMINCERLKYQRESNDEEIRKYKVMNELKKEANHEEIRARRLRIPWVIRWLM